MIAYSGHYTNTDPTLDADSYDNDCCCTIVTGGYVTCTTDSICIVIEANDYQQEFIVVERFDVEPEMKQKVKQAKKAKKFGRETWEPWRTQKIKSERLAPQRHSHRQVGRKKKRF